MPEWRVGVRERDQSARALGTGHFQASRAQKAYEIGRKSAENTLALFPVVYNAQLESS
jgi:hypothetical protein